MKIHDDDCPSLVVEGPIGDYGIRLPIHPSPCTCSAAQKLKELVEAAREGEEKGLIAATAAISGTIVEIPDAVLIEQARAEGFAACREAVLELIPPCYCGQDWSGRGLHAPDCPQPLADLIRALAAPERKEGKP